MTFTAAPWTIVFMATTRSSPETFPVRCRDPRNREGLQRLAEMTGQTMDSIVESAIEHEVVLQSADLDGRLADALEVVRYYNREVHLDGYLQAAASEDTDLGYGLHAAAAGTPDAPRPRASQQSAATLGVLAAFGRS